MMPPVFLFAYTVLFGLLILVTSGQSTDFQGPGYLTCPAADYDLQACSTIGLDPTVCTAEALLSCNFTQVVPSFDDSLTTIIIPLICDCVVALGCPGSCSFSFGDIPTVTPPMVSDASNFTGVGLVICPYVDYFGTTATCRPSVLDNNLTLCGSCDPTILDQSFGYTDGDETITFPLPCECLVMTNCPDTCNFTAVAITIAPTPAATDESPISLPINGTDAPLVTPTPDAAPSPALLPSPSSPIKAPSTNTMNAPTSSAYNKRGLHWMRIIVPVLVWSSLYL
jgi:hypothetical protein